MVLDAFSCPICIIIVCTREIHFGVGILCASSVELCMYVIQCSSSSCALIIIIIDVLLHAPKIVRGSALCICESLRRLCRSANLPILPEYVINVGLLILSASFQC